MGNKTTTVLFQVKYVKICVVFLEVF